MSEWEFVHHGYDPEQVGLREALGTVANGYLGTRGAAPEQRADGTHYPGSYLAGVYDRLVTDVEGHEVENEDMVNIPNWLPLSFRIDDGAWFDIDAVEVLEHVQILELRRGVLVRRVRFRDDHGRESSVAQRRIVHLRRKHLALLETDVRAENWSGTLTVRSALDGTVRNTGVERYRDLADRHLEVLDQDAAVGDAGDRMVLRVRTVQSRIEIVEAARTRLTVDGTAVEVDRADASSDGVVAQEMSVALEQGGTCRIDKTVAVFTSRDRAMSEPGVAALEELDGAGDLEDLLGEHVLEWDELWRRFSIRIDDSERASEVLNLHLFHLMQVASPATLDLDVGVPARGLHGEAYRGHIFWDEVFIFPLLIYRVPQIARDLLLYRHRRLPAARRAAAEAGYPGAMFPWQSGSSGREESQVLHLNPESGNWVPDDTHRQRHICAAIAYNVWQYVNVSDDLEFLAEAGAELFIEISRFWTGLATLDRVDDRYDIHGVVGPDEFHVRDPGWDGPGLRNNAYTNVMASWVLSRAPRMLDHLPDLQRDGLLDRLQVRREELEEWDHISRRLRIPFHDDRIISQFEGYEALEELDWSAVRGRHGDIQRLDRLLEADGDDVNRYKASKQADVLMLAYLLSYDELRSLFTRLGYDFDADVLRRNIDYYLARTSHGSTLSRVVHSWVVARSDRAASLRLFHDAVEADVSDVQGGTTAEGIHLGAMAGTVDLVERGYSGMEVCEGLLRFKPRLPEGIGLVEFRIYYRKRWITVSLTPDELRLTSEPTEHGPVTVACREELAELASGQSRSFGCSVSPP